MRLRGRARIAHIALFMLASRDDPALRTSVIGLAVSTAIGVGLLVGGVVRRRRAAGAWSGCSRSLLDIGGPYFFGLEGWKLVPGHFAERHGLIVIIALGESIVAIGVGAAPTSTPASSSPPCSASLVVGRRCGGCTSTSSRSSPRAGSRTRAPGRERNEIARDSFSYLHFPMVAGIVLLALGLKKTLGHVERRTCSSCRRRRCSAAPRSTCSRTSRSAGATSTASATQRLIVAVAAASR